MNKADLYKCISYHKKRLGITRKDYPLNIFEVCAHKISNVKIEAVPFRTCNLRGMVSLAPSKNENHVILVNGNKSIEEQNYYGTHEYCHIITVDRPGMTIRCFDKVTPNQDSYLEWLANEGAAEFLMPYKEILPIIKEHSYRFDDSDFPICDLIERLSNKYGVSTMVAQNRLNTLAYEIWQYLHGVRIDNVKVMSKNEQSKNGIKVDTLNDIENRRLFAVWSTGERFVKPFFDYSENYRDLANPFYYEYEMIV